MKSLILLMVFYSDRTTVKTCHGVVPIHMLRASKPMAHMLPTDIGSRIGVLYIPTGDNEADMHFIINGEDQGACVKRIPYKDAPLHAVVDVYGATTKVKIVQLYGGMFFF